MIYTIFVEMGIINFFITSLIYQAPHRETATKLYLPWDSKTFVGFWAAWILQFICRWLGGPLCVATESVCAGILRRAAAQFQILEIRLRDLTSPNSHQLAKYGKNVDFERFEMNKIAELVKEHLEIIQFGRSTKTLMRVPNLLIVF